MYFCLCLFSIFLCTFVSNCTDTLPLHRVDCSVEENEQCIHERKRVMWTTFTTLVDETEGDTMCWVHTCTMGFSMWQNTCVDNIISSTVLAEALVVLLIVFINHDIAICMICVVLLWILTWFVVKKWCLKVRGYMWNNHLLCRFGVLLFSVLWMMLLDKRGLCVLV